MDNNKNSWVNEEIFRILFNLSGSYLKYAQGNLQLKGANGLEMIDYFYNLINDLAKLENSAIKLSVKQQDLIKNCYAIIKQETKLILEYIESNLQTVEFTLESPEQSQESEENLSKLLKDYHTTMEDGIKLKEQLTQKTEELFKLKEDVRQLCSILELQELQLKADKIKQPLETGSIIFFQKKPRPEIKSVSSVSSPWKISYAKPIAKDVAWYAKELNNNILTSLIPELNDSISKIIDKREFIGSKIRLLESQGSTPSVQEQEDYEEIKQEIENILQLIEIKFLFIKPMFKKLEGLKKSTESLRGLVNYDAIIENESKPKEQLTQEKETLCKLKNDAMKLYSIPELQKLQLEEEERKSTSELRSTPFNINNFISDIKNLLSEEQIYYYKQIAKDAGLSVTEFNNFILTSLIPELDDRISRISNQEELNENQKKDVVDLTNYITSFQEGILNENRNQSINDIPSDPNPVPNEADNKKVQGNPNSQTQSRDRTL